MEKPWFWTLVLPILQMTDAVQNILPMHFQEAMRIVVVVVVTFQEE